MKVWSMLLAVLCSGLMLTTPVHADNKTSSSSSSATSQVGQRDHVQNTSDQQSGSNSKANIGKAFTTASQNVSGQYEKDAKDLPTGKTDLGNLDAGNVWSYIGPNAPQFASNLLTSNQVDLSTLMTGSSSKLDQGFGDAGTYAMTLDRLGLDHVKYEASDWAMNGLGRRIGAAVISLGLGCLTGVNWLFSIPSKLFGICGNVVGFMFNVSQDQSNPFHNVAGYIYNMYQAISNVGEAAWLILFIIGLLLALIGFRVGKSNNHVGAVQGIWSIVKRTVLALFNIIVLPILLASVMCGAFASLSDGFNGDTNAAATYPIYSNFVAFQNWVTHSRLALPNNVQITCTTNAGKLSPVTDNEVLAINAQGAGLANAQDVQRNLSSENPIGFDNNQQYGFINNAAQSFLNEWGSSATYNSADFASFARTHCASGKDDLDNSKNDLSKVLASLTYTTDGSLVAHEHQAFSSAAPSYKPGAGTCGVDKGGLSTLGMYNYLNSSTSGSTLRYVNANKLPTENGDNQHLSVGLAGRGINAVANFCAALISIWVFALTGLYCGVLCIQGAIMGFVKVGYASLKNAAGILQGTAQLITAAGMMIIEVGGTMLMYNVTINILLGLLRGHDSSSFLAPGQGMSATIMPHASNIALATANASGVAVYKLLISLLLLVIAIVLLRFRNEFLRGIAKGFEDAMMTVMQSIASAAGTTGSFGLGNIAERNAGFSTVDRNGATVHPLGVDNMRKAINNEEVVNNHTSGNGLSGRGAYNGATTISDPKTAFGKLHNAVANKQEYLDAKDAERNGTTTKKQQRADKRKYNAMTAAALVADTVGAHGAANDIRAARNAQSIKARQNAQQNTQQEQDVWKDEELDRTNQSIKDQQQMQAETDDADAELSDTQTMPSTISDSNDQVMQAQDMVAATDQHLAELESQAQEADQQVATLNDAETQAQQEVDQAQAKVDQSTPLYDAKGQLLMTPEQRELKDAKTHLANVQSQKANAITTQKNAHQECTKMTQQRQQAQQALQMAQTNAATLAYAKPVDSSIGRSKAGGQTLTNAQAMSSLKAVDKAYGNVYSAMQQAKQYQRNNQPVPQPIKQNVQQAMSQLQTAKKAAAHAGINSNTLVNQKAVHGGLQSIANEVKSAQVGELKGISIAHSHQTRDFRDNEASTNVSQAMQFLQ